MSALDELRPAQWSQLFLQVKAAGFEPIKEVRQANLPGDVLGYEDHAVPGLFHPTT